MYTKQQDDMLILLIQALENYRDQTNIDENNVSRGTINDVSGNADKCTGAAINNTAEEKPMHEILPEHVFLKLHEMTGKFSPVFSKISIENHALDLCNYVGTIAKEVAAYQHTLETIKEEKKEVFSKKLASFLNCHGIDTLTNMKSNELAIELTAFICDLQQKNKS